MGKTKSKALTLTLPAPPPHDFSTIEPWGYGVSKSMYLHMEDL